MGRGPPPTAGSLGRLARVAIAGSLGRLRDPEIGETAGSLGRLRDPEIGEIGGSPGRLETGRIDVGCGGRVALSGVEQPTRGVAMLDELLTRGMPRLKTEPCK